MTLDQAKDYAAQIVDWLRPYCDRIEVAGSIRREFHTVNDVDVVVIPKYRVEQDPTDMFEKRRVNLVREFLVRHVAKGLENTGWVKNEPKEDAVNILLNLKRCQLDVFCSTEANWGSLLVCRTGSLRHNVWLASLAKSKGRHWDPYQGVFIGNKLQPAATEDDIYSALDLPSGLSPQQRDNIEALYGPVEVKG